ncbi:serine hydrolase [Roseivirga sp. BDSF3-8]|uniref:serine hydrolase n=1 Tax=Roseivirga sp. BDSF3-8 TaxID=3241598 RepID=UPI0035318C10
MQSRNLTHMIRLLLLLPICLFLTACGYFEEQERKKRDAFADDLADLKAYFQIPGMAVMVLDDGEVIYEDYLGKADINGNIPVSSTTLFPVASITKTFSAALVLRLAEQDKLDLKNPVNRYLASPDLIDSIRIEHLLTHTSEGRVGEQFHYSNRYSLLTKVVEKATGKSFREAMKDEIFHPLDLRYTFLLASEEEGNAYKEIIATGYRYDGMLAKCPMDYGYSASAGLVTNLQDLAVFAEALEGDSLLSKDSKKSLITPYQEGFPYAKGLFTQTIDGERVLWAYGQYDCYSSLFVTVPDKDLTLILMANNNLMSDPARLINGDLTSSLFALSFLKNFIMGKQDAPILETDASLTDLTPKGEFYRKKLVAQAMATTYMSRFDSTRYGQSLTLLDKLFTHYPAVEEYASLNLIHALLFLNDVAGHYDKTYPERYNELVERASLAMLEKEPENPYVHIYLANYYDQEGDAARAREHYTWLAKATNFSDNWYMEEANRWIGSHPAGN